MQDQLSDILIYIKGTLRYRWYAICLAWLICVLGWTFVMFIPYTYTSKARVHVDSTTLLQPLLKGIAVQQDGVMLVRLMKKLMFTVPNLNKIIELSNLDLMVTNDRQRFKLYESMRKHIKLNGGRSDGLFEVSYESEEPNLSKNVVTAVLTVFSEQTKLSTLEDISSSQRFIEQQIMEYEVRLRNAEKVRETFKRSNFGLLPEEGQGQLAKLRSTNQELENAELSLGEALSKKGILKKQMKEIVDGGDAWSASDSVLELSPVDQQIKDLELRKMDLLLKYTDNHPAVSAIELTLIEVFRRKKEKDKERVGSGFLNAGALANPYVQQLKTSLNEAETEVASNTVRVNYLKEKIKVYKQQLNSRLTVETEMQNLNRDYETINDNYQKLVQRREQARISEKVDTETVSIKFEISDPPTVPLTPSGPKRSLLLTIVLIVGLGLGFGSAFLYYFVKPTYITSKQLRDITGLPVLGVISMQTPDKVMEKKWLYMFLSAVGGLVFIYIGLVSFEYMRLNGINPLNFININS